MALEFYLSNNNDDEIENEHLNFNKLYLIEDHYDEFMLLKNENIIIGKYLLSLFYYKNIILDIEGFNSKCKEESDDNDEQREILRLLTLAKDGDSEAQYILAVCYMDGIETQKNEKRAFNWFLKSEQNKYTMMNNIKIDEDERKVFEKDLISAI